MILVDSSVWIDYFQGLMTPQADLLDRLIDTEFVAIGDLMLLEVLQGFRHDRDFNRARGILTALPIIEIGGESVAVQAAINYRHLRGLGITVRKNVDTLIATGCILSGMELLHSDRDFDPFAIHLGLRVVGSAPASRA